MDSRLIAAAATLLVAGCASPPAALGNRTAEVTINGKNAGNALNVECSQAGWNWLIDSTGEKSGFSAAFQTGASMAAQSVQIRDLGGFTGGFWQGTVGDGKASISDGTFMITGTAEGFKTHNPTGEATATFEIKTRC